jgi:formylglycine-generating enzyme required for sulfatase activity/murein DD-endopeptidase MepM/ murein hydrolase activator NlpD
MKSNIVHRTGGFSLAMPVLATLIILPISTVRGAPLQLQGGTNGIYLTVGSLSQTGALFLQTAADLPSLTTNATALLQTNAPLTNALLLNVAPPGGLRPQAFFSALFFPGQSVGDFGDPENFTPPPDPTDILFSSGLPTNLTSGQTFPIVFIVTDPTGQPVPLTGTATLMVVSDSDGTLHPDATVTPPTGQMTNGFLQMQINVNATASLAGYTLALSIIPAPQGGIRPLGLTPAFLQVAFDLGPVPLTPQQISYYTNQLAQRRTANTDNGNTWDNPLTGGYGRVSGSFGEWRGDNNTRCHHGLDLPAPAASTVLASRSGVVSAKNVVSGIGAYLAIDHGNGWFSRYLHLDQNHILVHKGQAVVRGTPLANQLYSPPGWGVHLHFEVRYDSQNIPRWDIGEPGVAQDPVLTPGIFAVPLATALPQIDIFGLTGQAPRETVFQKAAPSGNGSSPVYLFVKTSDHESGNNPGPRSVSFWPEGAALPQTITPSNDTVLVSLYAPLSGTDANEGFARYRLANNKASTRDYFRYWFQWDTSAYATNRVGPRSFTNSVQGYSGLTTNYTFTFGPQVKGSSIVPVGGQQFMFTNVAYLGTNVMADPSQQDTNFSQPDQYMLQIIQASGQPLAGVTWSGPMAGTDTTKVFTVHTNEAVYKFTLPDGQSSQGLHLRVSSLLVTNIAHEVCFCGVNMALIPAGTFTMGDTLDGESDAVPISVMVSAFCMDTNLVSFSQWQAVYSYATSHGYGFDNPGSGKGANHPVQTINWYDCVKWCNARSQQEGKTPVYYMDAGFTQVYTTGEVSPYVNWSAQGYRLPTEAEWEKAARGGLSGLRFPWGNTISESQANYAGSTASFSYDLGPDGYNSIGSIGGTSPATSPVGSFAANGYGLYDMAGNVWEWCWDWYGTPYAGGSDPRGPASGSLRVFRGGGWYDVAFLCRAADRVYDHPANGYNFIGFRSVLPAGQ